jgi:hypothetical protein
MALPLQVGKRKIDRSGGYAVIALPLRATRRIVMNRNWRQQLSRPLVVVGNGDRVLSTLNEAGILLIECVHAGSELAEVSAAIELLMIAAETGEPDDIAAATDEVEMALRTTHSRRQLRTGS